MVYYFTAAVSLGAPHRPVSFAVPTGNFGDIFAGYIARKGSVTVDGVSLTVNRVEGREFSINLIPHTVQVTTLKRLAAGSSVNLEIDLIARYMERMLAWRDENPGTEGNPA